MKLHFLHRQRREVPHLYIPLRSDETIHRDGLSAVTQISFISHYVQMKLKHVRKVQLPGLAFISHYVQMKLAISSALSALTCRLYIPLRSDETHLRRVC